jgi:hypothetical protein
MCTLGRRKVITDEGLEIQAKVISNKKSRLLARSKQTFIYEATTILRY